MSEGTTNSSLLIPDLSIKGFRAIKDLSINELGRVTLITGKNNTGKSSILEALRLFANNASPDTLQGILTSREEFVPTRDNNSAKTEEEIASYFLSLFHGFPDLSFEIDPIEISTCAGSRLASLAMHLNWLVEREDADGSLVMEVWNASASPESELSAGMILETEQVRVTYTLRRFLRRPRPALPQPILHKQGRMPCVMVSPFGGQRTSALGHLWDDIVLTDDEREVVAGLQTINDSISAVSMVGSEDVSLPRRAMVRAKGISHPVPLRSFGDGMNHLFAIILSLISARGGVLLIDEFENGLHFTVHLDVWRMIFRLARRLDIQVFATSHSWDAIESFQQAAAEAPEEAALVRLTRRQHDIISTVFTEDELAIVTRDKIEVR